MYLNTQYCYEDMIDIDNVLISPEIENPETIENVQGGYSFTKWETFLPQKQNFHKLVQQDEIEFDNPLFKITSQLEED